MIDAGLIIAKCPLRCTAMTASHSSSVMLKIMRSRRMPATLMMQSSRPKVSSAVLITDSPPAMVAILAMLATAWPPSPLISRTTSSAGPASAPVPSTLTPASLTTTFAPSRAASSAMPRPIPRPAPVIAMTFPSNCPGMGLLLLCVAALSTAAIHDRSHLWYSPLGQRATLTLTSRFKPGILGGDANDPARRRLPALQPSCGVARGGRAGRQCRFQHDHTARDQVRDRSGDPPPQPSGVAGRGGGGRTRQPLPGLLRVLAKLPWSVPLANDRPAPARRSLRHGAAAELRLP